MPVSQPYLAAVIANLRLAPANQMLSELPQIETALGATGMNQTKINGLLSTFKTRLMTMINTQVQLAANEATSHALASAVESDDKNSQLTPLIEGTPVNPVAVSNALEEAAMIETGTQAALQLSNFISQAEQQLS